jgi:hypothetical protein
VHAFAKFLQALALAVVAFALYYGVTTEGEGVLGREMMFMAMGAALFLLGRVLETRGR